jgi:hypothetical protein
MYVHIWKVALCEEKCVSSCSHACLYSSHKMRWLGCRVGRVEARVTVTA